jgi:hypothetical protein
VLHGVVVGGNKIGESNCVRIRYFGIVTILAIALVVVHSMLISDKLTRAMDMKVILHIISLHLQDGTNVVKGRGWKQCGGTFGQLAM